MDCKGGLTLKFWSEPGEDICLILSEPSNDVLMNLLNVIKTSQNLGKGVLKQINALMGIHDEDIFDDDNDEEDLVFRFKTESFENISVSDNEHLDSKDDLNLQSAIDSYQDIPDNFSIEDDMVKSECLDNNDLKITATKSSKLSNSKNLSCKDCDKQFKIPALLKRHRFVHTKEKNYSCDQCNFKASLKDILKKHKKRIHLGLFCKVCRKYFTSASDLNVHSCTEKTFKCDQCEETYRLQSELKNHVRHVHDGGKSTCKDCNAELASKRSLKRHMESVHGNLPREFICDLCSYAFTSNSDLKRHLKIHDGSSVSDPCEYCGKTFSSKNTLNMHINSIHIKEYKEHCSECGKGFLFISDLKNHIDLEHKKLRPHICDICATDFKTTTGLKQHIAHKHTDEGRRKCNYCEIYSSVRSVKRHELYIHEKHKWTFVCETCSEKFPASVDLRNHMRTHVNVKPWSCKGCEETFMHKHNIRVHVKKYHGGDLSLYKYNKEKDFQF